MERPAVMRTIVTKLRALGDVRTSQLYSQRKTLNEAADEIDRLGAALTVIAEMPNEDDEWDGVDKFRFLRDLAKTAVELKE